MAKKRIQETETRKLWDEDPVKIPLQKSRKRAVILITVIFFCFAVIVVRLVDIMIFDHEKLASRAEQQYHRKKTIESQRGVMWDRRMKEMVANIETSSLYAVPSRIKETRALSKTLSPLVNVPSEQLNTLLVNKKNKDFLWLARKMDIETVRNMEALREQSKQGEFGFLAESRRYYPKGQTAAHLLGFTDIDNKGISGLELYYDEYLKGKAESFSVGTDARGNRLSNEIRDGVPGNNLVLTIDEGIQYIVERELTNAIETWGAKAASAIMMDPRTGEVLAISNRPTYDPNYAGKAEDFARRNRAITDLYEPGSTFKTILASAALENEVVGLNNRFDVSRGFIVVGGKSIKDVHKNGVLSFQEVFQHSSNVGAVMIGLKLGAERYYEYIKKFGFGDKTGIDLPGEAKGILRKTSGWSGTSLAAISIGQEIGVTPMQIIKAYSAVANGGLLMKPYFVSDIISPSGEVIKRTRPEVERRVISEKTAKKVRDILKTVVEEGGTATKAYIKGNLVAGKTGTAQLFDPETGRYSKNRFISSFVGFVPADDPRLALIVVVYEPRGSAYGGVVAAPVFKNIMEHTLAYLDIPMEREGNQILLVTKSR